MNNQFASRAGEKLAFGLKEFNINVKNKICADFGCSTGGFTDCLLQNGALKAYAVDTAYGELAWKLRIDKRVLVMEKTNAMHVKLPEKMDIITSDTSWTKLKNVFPNILANIKENGNIITLIKPHYEADKKLLKKGVLDEKTAEEVAFKIFKELQTEKVIGVKIVKSPLIGAKGGNSEYLAHFKLVI